MPMRHLALILLLPAVGFAQDLPKADPRFTRTAEMVTMRDGVKLFTTVYVPKKATGPLPIIFIRTPYGIDNKPEWVFQNYFRDLVSDGYIFAFQDIRGRFRSEGKFVMTRPARDAKDPKAIDEASDTSDTIDWLLKNADGNNGRVGMLGVSYDGWLTAAALLDPHPALKAVSPQASPADMFLGDDFHHNGTFRLSYGFEYVAMMETDKTNANFKFDRKDTFDWYLKLGALSNVKANHFGDKMPTWNDFVAHPNYDEFWKKQSLEPRLTSVKVPTLNVGGWFDQEDFRGPLKIYEHLEKQDKKGQNFLVVGPWNHGGWGAGPGDRLGKIGFDAATGKHFRGEIQAPFFAHYLKDRGKAERPEAMMFQTGTNKWVGHAAWPPKDAVAKKLYFGADSTLTTDAPTADGHDEYISDPAKPVPYRPRPVTATYPGKEWKEWMVEDQRFTHHRPDVLSYETDPLTEDVVLAGNITAKLFAATTGTDADWVVRLIDVYPEEYPDDATMSGYQLLVCGEPLRGRFRNGFEKAEAIKADAVEAYTVDLNWGHHCFRKGHRIMVQISSSWFPLYDRNPQKYVPNIFEAKDSDFQKATQSVYRSAKQASHIELQVLPAKK